MASRPLSSRPSQANRPRRSIAAGGVLALHASGLLALGHWLGQEAIGGEASWSGFAVAGLAVGATALAGGAITHAALRCRHRASDEVRQETALTRRELADARHKLDE
ncbi:MAG TPA: hypothetical protein VEB64_17265, partial [Azospirillaceae bacterium]|nr:hypothetical protein [Azospirillaceae bacterium]